MNIRYVVLSFSLIYTPVMADNSTLDAAIGGGIGGAAGAAIGNEIGGRDGAIVGGAIGGAVGAAVNTDESNDRRSSRKTSSYRSEPGHVYPASRFCPPGSANFASAKTEIQEYAEHNLRQPVRRVPEIFYHVVEIGTTPQHLRKAHVETNCEFVPSAV